MEMKWESPYCFLKKIISVDLTCTVIQYIHDRDVIHVDLKSNNGIKSTFCKTVKNENALGA